MRHSIKYECSTWNKKDWQNEITIVNKQEYRDKNCFAIVEMWNNSIISTFLRIRGLLFPIWRTCQCNCFWSVESFSICLIEVYFTYTFFKMKGMFASLPLGPFVSCILCQHLSSLKKRFVPYKEMSAQVYKNDLSFSSIFEASILLLTSMKYMYPTTAIAQLFTTFLG